MATRFAPAWADEEEAACTIWYIARALGRTDYGVQRLCTYVQGLIDQFGFPAPFPALTRKGLVQTVGKDSRWPRRAVDQWLHDFLPPDAAAAVDAAARASAASEMDQAAFTLKLVKGGRSA